MCKVSVGNVVLLFLAFYCVLKRMEPLSSDRSTETDVVRRLGSLVRVMGDPMSCHSSCTLMYPVSLVGLGGLN